jgi:hypothetical protein
VGGGLPRVPTPWKEGGTIYLQQCHADASLGLAYIVGPHTELEADYHFTYFFQHEKSHEDNNVFELIDNGPKRGLRCDFNARSDPVSETRQRIMGLRCHNVPAAGTHGPARRPAQRPSPPMPCGSPPAGLVISSNHGGFQPRAARPGSPEDSHSILNHPVRSEEDRVRHGEAEGLGVFITLVGQPDEVALSSAA